MVKIIRKSLFISVVLVFFIHISTSCDETFAPLKENDKYYFSIYGYLDLEADTQWIRIMPIRETIYYSKDPIDARVTLTNLNTGQTIAMNDSLFQINVWDTEDDYAFRNFWTDVPIEPNTEYEIRAERSDGKFSWVTVSTPDSFPTPAVDFDPPYQYLEVTNVEIVADIRTFWRVYNPTRKDTIIYQINRTDNLIDDQEGIKVIRLRMESDIDYLEERNRSEQDIEIFEKQIWIVSAGGEWIDFPAMDKEIISLPEVTSNVENGIGYVVGASIKIIPYASCWDDADPNVLVPCPTERPLWK